MWLFISFWNTNVLWLRSSDPGLGLLIAVSQLEWNFHLQWRKKWFFFFLPALLLAGDSHFAQCSWGVHWATAAQFGKALKIPIGGDTRKLSFRMSWLPQHTNWALLCYLHTYTPVYWWSSVTTYYIEYSHIQSLGFIVSVTCVFIAFNWERTLTDEER